MFGYVKPWKPEMKVREFETYNAVYCGLCKQLQKSFGFLSRLTLNFDFTFLALLSMALDPSPPSFLRQGCAFNPLKKKACCQQNSHLEYAAGAAMIMFYHKIMDNCHDDVLYKKVIWYIALPYASHMRKKSRKQWPALDDALSAAMAEQRELERNHCKSIDQAAEPIARFLAFTCESIAENPAQKRILNRMGYLLGRWIYLIDALDDLEEDFVTGSYNPYIELHGLRPAERQRRKQADKTALDALRRSAVMSLNQTAAEIGSAYGLLDLYKFQPILDNIIYLGLRSSMNRILLKEEKTDDRSL